MVLVISIFSASGGRTFQEHICFEVLLLVPVDCVVNMFTMLDNTNNVFGLFVVILTTMFFSVANPCSVSYRCRCYGMSLTSNEVECESLLNKQRTYINCSTTCVIPNNAFKDLPCKRCLDIVQLGYHNISDIQPDVFTDLKDVQYFNLNNNELQELHQNTFQHFHKLMELDVSFNRLRYIHPEAFVHMISFYHLDVSHNAFVLNGTILYSRYINILDAAFCNPAKDESWYVLKHPLFSGLPNLTKLVLEGNAIGCVMWDTFSNNKRLSTLDLKNNMLKFIPHQFTLCSHVIELDLSNNPLDCNCHVKMYATACTNNTVKLDEVSCGTSRGLEHLSCDDVSLTGPPDTGVCDSDIGSTYAVTSALPTSVGTSEDSTTSAVFSTTSETVMSSLYPDRHIPTSAPKASDENESSVESYPDRQIPASAPNRSERLVEPSSTATTGIPNNLSKTPKVLSTKDPVSNSSTLIVFGVVLVLVVIIMAGAMTVVILRVCKQQDLGGSVPATEYFNIHFGNNNQDTDNKVDENKKFHYISLGSLEKHKRPKKDLHYLCRDVTTLHEVSDQGQPETASCLCSVILERNISTGRKNWNLEEHVYEEVK